MQKQDDIMKIHWQLSIVLRVMSSDRLVNVQRFSTFCNDLYAEILEKFPWVNVSKSIHALLAHIPALIERNNGKGLLNLSEQGSESKLEMIVQPKL